MSDFCPKCKSDLRGEDIYSYFLNNPDKAPQKTLDQVLNSIREYPELFPTKTTPTEEQLRTFNQTQLNAWSAAQSYGWSFTKPKTFSKVIGIEVRGVFDGIIVWQCPNCLHKWKRFKWVDDKYLKD